MLLGKRNSLFFSLFVKEGRALLKGCEAGSLVRRRDVWSREGKASGEVNFLLGGQEHVEWPAEGLSSTGAPGQLALHRTCTRCGALTPSLIQSALHPPPC